MQNTINFFQNYFFPSPFWQGDIINLIFFAFVSSITPGPNNTLLMTSGLRFGIRRSLPHLAGVSLGFGMMLLSIGFIINFLSPDTLKILRWVSMALILYVAFKIATASVVLDDAEIPPAPNQTKDGTIKKIIGGKKPWGFWQACAFQWVNPKGLMMAFATLTAYQVNAFPGAILFTSINFVCVAWLIAGAMLRHYIKDHPHITRAIYIFMAIGLIATLWL